MAMYDKPAEIIVGSAFDQQRVINETERLQDYRRRREGHLILGEDGPMLVIAFGRKYDGPNANKYKIQGKYDIPCGYKVIIKWEEDEIVFMTRQGTFGPEFQIIYLPNSEVAEDFTLFEWNADIAEIWDRFLTVFENKEDKDMRRFNKGPWRTFGVERDEVQIALAQDSDQKTYIDGVLYAYDGQEPDFEEYKKYLGFNDAEDRQLKWVVQAFKEDPRPSYFFQYVKDNMVYWVDARTQEPTWKHPHYDKYKKMLQMARVQKPVPHWKAIAAFQVEFLYSQLFTWECEITQEYPPVETVDNVMELARIFNVDVIGEPYLVHVLKRALRHYATVVKEKREVKDIEDFRNLMQRYRDLIDQFELAQRSETASVIQAKLCVNCPDSSKKDAVLFCDQCKDLFCHNCFDSLHQNGRRKNHSRTWVELGVCAECNEALALFHCVQCADLYCADCFQDWHIRGGRRNHIPIILRSLSPEQGGGNNAGAIAKSLDKARSPWLAFEDENRVALYYNVSTGEARRDKPLECVNEPLEDNVGGGLSGGWAGSWGANMFEDPLEG